MRAPKEERRDIILTLDWSRDKIQNNIPHNLPITGINRSSLADTICLPVTRQLYNIIICNNIVYDQHYTWPWRTVVIGSSTNTCYCGSSDWLICRTLAEGSTWKESSWLQKGVIQHNVERSRGDDVIMRFPPFHSSDQPLIPWKFDLITSISGYCTVRIYLVQ